MVLGTCEQRDNARAFEVRPVEYAAAHEYAIERVLADVDSFADFLSGACFQVRSVDSERAMRLPSRRALADIPTLLHAAIVSAGRRDDTTCADALRIIVQSYLDDSAARIGRIAAEVA